MPLSLIRRRLAFTVFVLELLPLLPRISAAQASPNRRPIIEAQGHGEVQARPDLATINLEVDTIKNTANETVKANASVVAAVTQALKLYLAGKDDDNIQTANRSISPQYASYGQVLKKSFFATRRITIMVPPGDLALTGELGNLATENGARFTSTQDDADSGKARVIIDLSSTAPTPGEAARETALRAQKLQQSLEAKLNGGGAIRTEDTVSENSATGYYSSQHVPTVMAYIARSTMTIKLSQLDECGNVVDTAIKAGASQLNSITFEVSESRKLQSQAIASATENAEAKAQAQASALHLKLGPLLKSSTAPFQSSMPRAIPAMAGVIEKRISPIDPGQVSVSADVTLTYATE